jgi:hypothetical protein
MSDQRLWLILFAHVEEAWTELSWENGSGWGPTR